MKYVKNLNNEDFEETLFGRETIKLDIPKRTNVLIVTFVADAKNDATSISTRTYNFEEIKDLLLES